MGFLVFVLFIVVIYLLGQSFEMKDNYKRMDMKLDGYYNQLDDLKEEIKLLKRNKNDFVKENVDDKKSILENDDLIQNEEVIESTEKIVNQDVVSVDDNYWNEYEAFPNSNKKMQIKDNSSFEGMVLGNLFTIIGAIVLIICCVLFAKLVSPFIIFTPIMKIILSVIVGAGMIFAGDTMKNEKLVKYSEVLIGTGFTILFISSFCMSVVFNLVTPAVSIIAGIGLLIIAFLLADKRKTSSMLGISLFGGYFNIIALSQLISLPSVLCYLLFLNVLSAIYVYRNPDKYIINSINLIFTLLYLTLSTKVNSMDMYFPCALWSIYLIFDIIAKQKKTYSDNLSLLHWINLSVLTLFSLCIFKFELINIGYTLIFASVVHLLICLYYLHKDSEYVKLHFETLILTTTIAIFFTTASITRVTCWTIEAIFLTVLGSILNLNYVAKWIASVYALLMSVTILTSCDFIINNMTSYNLIFNEMSINFIIPLCGMIISKMIIRYNNTREKVYKWLNKILSFTITSLVYLYSILEINILVERNDSIEYANFVKQMLYPIIGLIYSYNLTLLNPKKEFAIVESISSAFKILSMLALVMFGLSFNPIENFIPVFNIRFAAFILAIACAIRSAKNDKSEIWRYISLILGFILITVETKDYINKLEIIDNYWITINWLLYSVVIVLIGIAKKVQYLKYTGIAIIGLSICKIIFADTINLELGNKLIIYLLLGISLMGLSYYYNKKN